MHYFFWALTDYYYIIYHILTGYSNNPWGLKRSNAYSSFRGCLYEKWSDIKNGTTRFVYRLHGKNEVGQCLCSLYWDFAIITLLCNYATLLSLFKEMKHSKLKCRENIKAIALFQKGRTEDRRENVIIGNLGNLPEEYWVKSPKDVTWDISYVIQRNQTFFQHILWLFITLCLDRKSKSE